MRNSEGELKLADEMPCFWKRKIFDQSLVRSSYGMNL